MSSGYTLCPCCGYDTISDDDTDPELCSDCEDAGCDADGSEPQCSCLECGGQECADGDCVSEVVS